MRRAGHLCVTFRAGLADDANGWADELADVVMDYPDVYGFTRPYGYCQAYAARKNVSAILNWPAITNL